MERGPFDIVGCISQVNKERNRTCIVVVCCCLLLLVVVVFVVVVFVVVVVVVAVAAAHRFSLIQGFLENPGTLKYTRQQFIELLKSPYKVTLSQPTKRADKQQTATPYAHLIGSKQHRYPCTFGRDAKC